MEIRAADAAGQDFDPDLVRTRLPIGQFNPLERSAQLIEDHRMHVKHYHGRCAIANRRWRAHARRLTAGLADLPRAPAILCLPKVSE
jgi:hypothetical protein